MAFLDPPRLPVPRAGRFSPGQPGAGDWPKVPGYSCAHCGCLVLEKNSLWFGTLLVHAWSKSVFCRFWRGDLRLARRYYPQR